MVDEFHNNDPDKSSLTQARLLQFAQENNENADRIFEGITTRYSDDDYPWPAGMAPWLIERRGSGKIPDEQGVISSRICQSPFRTEISSGKIKSQELSLRHLFVVSALFPLLLPKLPLVPNTPKDQPQPSQIQSKSVQEDWG